MKKNKIAFLLAIIFLPLLVTSGKANATEGACIYMIGQMHIYACADDEYADYYCVYWYGGTFYPGKKCCSAGSADLRTYYPNVQQGCCSKDNNCTSGVIDMGYLQTCGGYECNEGNYECNNGTCESSTLITLEDFKAYAKSSRVSLNWFTESETDNAGYNLYRAESENGEYEKINSALIPAQGSSTQGSSYE